MADTRMIPYSEIISGDIATLARNQEAAMYSPDAGYAPTPEWARPVIDSLTGKYGHNWWNTGGILNSDAILNEVRSRGLEENVLRAKSGGWWDQGYRPGMDLPQYNQSQLGDVVEFASPLATMAGLAFGGNALFGAGGGAGAGA